MHHQMNMKRTRKTILPLFKLGTTGISPVSAGGASRLLYQHKICEMYIIPLLPVAHNLKLGHIAGLLPHLINWNIEFESGYWLNHPGTGELIPALLTLGADPAEANTLAVMAGFDWTLHVFFYAGKPGPRGRGEFCRGYDNNLRWYFKKEIHD
jgi:hypothetical protein